jgi:HEAT repeat protein
MSSLLWSFDQLSRFTRYEDPEVRYWAADRLVALFPDEAPDAIAPLILDDHDATPELVAEHLGRHGDARHVAALLKGFRKGGGLMPGRCLESLARLRFESLASVAETALHQRDVSEGSLGLMVKTLAGSNHAGGDPAAAEMAHEFLLRRPELFAEPSALEGALALMATRDFTELMLKWITALHFRGLDQIDACVRVLLEELQLEDCGWCLRTDRSGRVDLERTLKAVESGYDLDVRDALSRAVRARIAETLGRGDFPAIAACLGGVVAQRAAELRDGNRADDPLPARLEALGRAFQAGPVLEIADRLGPALHQWLIGLLLAAAVKVFTYRNHVLELKRCGQDVDRLLDLAGAESSALLEPLPELVAAAAPAGSAARGRVVDWCVRTLEARGPFFPKAHALNILGELQAEALIPEIAAHLADDNPYIYHAAERALSRFGDPVIEHAGGVIARGDGHPEALQSLVRIVCEMTTEGSLALMLEHTDAVFDTLGPEAAAECAGLLGRQEMIPNLRRWLDRAPALVGHALLLVGAINNVPIPEEETILKAIDEYWKGAGDGSDGEPPGPWLM